MRALEYNLYYRGREKIPHSVYRWRLHNGQVLETDNQGMSNISADRTGDERIPQGLDGEAVRLGVNGISLSVPGVEKKYDVNYSS